MDLTAALSADLVCGDVTWRLDPDRPYASIEPGRPWGVILIPDAGHLRLDGRRFGPVLVPPGAEPIRAGWQGARTIRELRVMPHAFRGLGRHRTGPVPLSELPGSAFAPANPLVTAAVERLMSSSPTLSVNALARALGCSQRHLIATVHAETGLTPALIGRLARLDGAYRAVSESRTPLAEIAAAHGFADQAHMTRLAKTHWGMTPSAVRHQVASVQDGVMAF